MLHIFISAAGDAIRPGATGLPVPGYSARIVDEDGLKQIDREIKDTIQAAADFAQQSPEPDPAELYTDVLAPV